MARVVRNSSNSKTRRSGAKAPSRGKYKKKDKNTRRSQAVNKPRVRKTRARVQQESGRSFFREVFCLALGVFAVFWGFSIASSLGASDFLLAREAELSVGPMGSALARKSLLQMGLCAFCLPLLMILTAAEIWRFDGAGIASFSARVVRAIAPLLALALCATTLASLVFGYVGGGAFGEFFAETLSKNFGDIGAYLLSTSVFLISLSLVSSFNLGQVAKVSSSGLKTAGGVSALLASFSLVSFRRLGTFVSGASRLAFDGSIRALSFVWNAFITFCLDFSRHMRLVGEESLSIPDPAQQAAVKTAASSSSAEELEGFVLGTEEKSEGSATKKVAKPSSASVEQEKSLPVYTRKDRVSDEPLEADAIDPELKISRRDDTWDEVKQSLLVDQEVPAQESSADRYASYQKPDLSLLVAGASNVSVGPDDDSLIANSKDLEQALLNFKIGGRVVEVHPGPVITMYQFQPAAGVKVQRVINLADDLALALKVASVRVYAPVPGKGTIGIEVPNAQREIVRLHDVLNSEAFQTEGEDLPLALGKDTYGDAFVACLPRMPHLLIAGATGTGKSVCINSLLLSLLCKSSPANLQLLLIDPKMLELSIYEDIPHLKSPVVTNVNKAKGVLHWAVEEMERRYRLLKDVGVRDLASYNRLARESQANLSESEEKRQNVTISLEERDVVATGSSEEGLDRKNEDLGDKEAPADVVLEELPRIVVVVDELADLMLSVGREVEELLTRLAQKARAAGIHLILATQRPSVNVITGLIKANFPARISFKVTSKIDSRTVLDSSGAERLLGQGDMLYSSPSIGGLKRLHSPYVSDQEVNDIADWLRGQGEPQYDETIEQTYLKLNQPSDSSADCDGDGNQYDELYDSAVSLVVDKGQASTSMVQRAFRIGYNRAARILEVMEKEGVVGPADGSRPRKVLVGGVQDPSFEDDLI